MAAASQDYLESAAVPPTESIDAMIELLKLFPDMGSVVSLSQRIRRALLGRRLIGITRPWSWIMAQNS